MLLCQGNLWLPMYWQHERGDRFPLNILKKNKQNQPALKVSFLFLCFYVTCPSNINLLLDHTKCNNVLRIKSKYVGIAVYTCYGAPCCSFDSFSESPPNMSFAGGRTCSVAQSHLPDPLVHRQRSDSYHLIGCTLSEVGSSDLHCTR